jgi:RNA polymerase sigma-70 factor (ECF subfamily)
MDASDADLVAQARAGDGDAFRVLVERHSRKVYRLAFRLIGNEEDAEDIVQETFLRAYRSLERFNEQAQFSSWIYRIASNHALDMLRGRKRRTERSLSAPVGDSDGLSVADRLASPDPGPDRVAQGGQLHQRIQGALEELTPQERVAFTLRHYEGHTVEEISGFLNVSASATRNAVFRAVQKVRRALQPGEGEPLWRS